MSKLNLCALSILLAAGSMSCNKSKPRQTLKYVGVATTYKQEIWRGPDTSYHLTKYDTLDLEATVIVDGKSIQFLSANDSIIVSATFDIKDSVTHDNTYIIGPGGFHDADQSIRKYKMNANSLNYSYEYNRSGGGTLTLYKVKFTGIKQ